MAGAYSQDLRDRAIDAVVVDGMSRRAAAARFGVSESVAIKWVERFERSGSRTAGKIGGYRPRKTRQISTLSSRSSQSSKASCEKPLPAPSTPSRTQSPKP